jgi:uncharacterized protein
MEAWRMEAWSYRGRRALVTGASAGIGEAFAGTLAARGMDLVLAARREERLREMAERLTREHGIACEVVAVDLAEDGAPERLWQAAMAGGPIHLLVNNAGVGAQGPFAEVPLERQRTMIRLNVEAVVELTHLALGEMRPLGSGGIINVSSIASFLPLPHLAVYAASKAFVQTFTEAVWAEARKEGVRVVALAPGRTPTEFQAVAGTGKVTMRTFGARTPAAVAEAGLVALEGGKEAVVPGLANRLIAGIPRLLPRKWIARVVRHGMARRH